VACNRPFGNERASEPMRNYPYRPGPEDIEKILHQIWDDNPLKRLTRRENGDGVE
jgi:hypothetical protein